MDNSDCDILLQVCASNYLDLIFTNLEYVFASFSFINNEITDFTY